MEKITITLTGDDPPMVIEITGNNKATYLAAVLLTNLPAGCNTITVDGEPWAKPFQWD